MSDCKKPKKDNESVSINGSGIDQLNFEEFKDNESSESKVEMFNLGECKDQDDVLTDQDVESIGDILQYHSFVQEIIRNNGYRAKIDRALSLPERSRLYVLQAIMLMSDVSFEVNHYESGMQTVNIQDAYLDLESHMNTPVQEQVSEDILAIMTCPSLCGAFTQFLKC